MLWLPLCTWMCTYTRLNTHAHRHVSAPWYVIRDIGESPSPGPVCASPPLSHPRLLHRREPEHPPHLPSRFFLSFARVPHGTLNLSYATRYHEPRRGTLAIERVLRIPPCTAVTLPLPPCFPAPQPRRLKARLNLTIPKGYRKRATT